ncbi:cation transporter [Arthrobacter sp. CAN_C5]|uniref:cation transporter n=1 Tax=Arthrobacter sp. CAN_C5 TaxID=2760706 RepID=UPI0028AE3920|nr:cation transporter [Arthrobacter sp. CAN_C5]
MATRPATRRSTYGYQRPEVLAALANAIILVVIAVVIIIEALRRISTRPDIRTDVMIVTAMIGAAANLACLLSLRDGQTESLGVHDIHAWTITSGVPVFSAHVVVDGGTLHAEGVDQVLDRLTHCLRNHFATAPSRSNQPNMPSTKPANMPDRTRMCDTPRRKARK